MNMSLAHDKEVVPFVRRVGCAMCSQLLPPLQCNAWCLGDKSLNLVIRNAKNSCRAALNEKMRSDHHDYGDNVNGPAKLLVMLK